MQNESWNIYSHRSLICRNLLSMFGWIGFLFLVHDQNIDVLFKSAWNNLFKTRTAPSWFNRMGIFCIMTIHAFLKKINKKKTVQLIRAKEFMAPCLFRWNGFVQTPWRLSFTYEKKKTLQIEIILKKILIDLPRFGMKNNSETWWPMKVN